MHGRLSKMVRTLLEGAMVLLLQIGGYEGEGVLDGGTALVLLSEREF